MEYVGFVFGIFGLFAFLECSTLKKRMDALEDQLAETKGTKQYDERQGLYQQVHDCIGQQVQLQFKEDYGDWDIVDNGSSKHGTNTIVDTDGEWVLVRLESPKGTKEKLIRLASISGITK